MRSRLWLLSLAALVLGACHAPTPDPPEDPPEVAMGERLFLETRFAQFFAANAAGVNARLAAGDPVMESLETMADPRPGPFRGLSMNCRQCHLVDEPLDSDTTGLRTYNDFARRSPIPDRGDGHTHTPRNSPPLVNSNLMRDVPLFLHFDGEFPTPEDLVVGTFTGRNFGWLPGERTDAVAHVARVMREDDGSDPLAASCRGLPYATLLAGVAPEIPTACRLPEAFRVDTASASDDAVLSGVAKIVSAYMRTLVYAQDAGGGFVGSPFDRFLILNRLPRRPDTGESALDYARRLRAALDRPEALKPLANPDRLSFAHHDHGFGFGSDEIAGLRIFLAEPAGAAASDAEIAAGGIGNCVACHAPPTFSDFGFHNNGAAQASYDGIHGAGAFAALAIPGLAERMMPAGGGPFLDVPAADRPGRTDLGLWNVFGNPGIPGPQATLTEVVRGLSGASAGATAAELLPRTIGWFKTATLRDLGQSAPYFHDGSAAALEDAVRHYKLVAGVGRAGGLRNGGAQLAGIALTDADTAPLVAFLRSLDEDYE
jgi:hypothetical protein